MESNQQISNLIGLNHITMKTILIIMLMAFGLTAYSQDSTTQWQTIRVLIGVADTAWKFGETYQLEDSLTYSKIEVQYRSNNAVIQQRQRYYFKK